ncbi:sigma 54-interacting transcriptional regulator [Niallia sp. NCCP-28]|uniref:sigma 54-interacting transcriptional regulator n=1 Tax=Niallia sp. NCCP-28 TaxID=2934712 RepID=UPI0020878F0A|nr:sigma 54-interacting transcriptional regulator [Niallia sp. NCCP-28]GKU81123.1 hypothetical protein NCCP28_05190 [Niallia sp. NCCP-28]
MQHSFYLKQIFNEIQDGLLIIDQSAHVIFSNDAAMQKLDLANHKNLREIWPNSSLMTVLETGKIEMEKLMFQDECQLVASSIPIDHHGKIIGALCLLLPKSMDANSKRSVGLEVVLHLDLQNIAEILFSNDAKEKVNSSLSLFGEKTADLIEGNIHLVPTYKKLIASAKELLCMHYFHQEREATSTFADIICQSDAMQLPYQQAMLASTVETAVLIRGQSGTGKKMFASAIHHESSQKGNTFKAVSCIKMTEKLAEEFLYFKNDGDNSKEGKTSFQGTLYFDEIGKLPLSLQKKLLVFLTEKNFKNKNNRIRIMAGSSENLEKQMVEGKLLEALYYELNKFCIHLPSLKERAKDIPLLIAYFANELNQTCNRHVEEVDQAVYELLLQHEFYANIKELKAVIQLAMISLEKEDRKLKKKHFKLQRGNAINEEYIPEINEEAPLSLLVEKYEKVIIENTLKKQDGNKTLTAKALGLSVRNLYYKLEKYGFM